MKIQLIGERNTHTHTSAHTHTHTAERETETETEREREKQMANEALVIEGGRETGRSTKKLNLLCFSS